MPNRVASTPPIYPDDGFSVEMYLPYFIGYMAIGFGISGLVFFWALKNGQFADQKRAAFLPLQEDAECPQVKVRPIHRYEAFVLMGLACLGLLLSASVLAFSLLKSGIPW